MVVSVEVGVEQPQHAGVGGGEGGGGVHHVRLDILCQIILFFTIHKARRAEYSRWGNCWADGRDAYFWCMSHRL